MGNAVFEPELIWQYFNQATSGFFVEVGANEPQAGSQTWLLESHGWRGLLVEALPHLAARLRAERPRSIVVQAACGSAEHPAMVEFHEAQTSGHSGLRRHSLEAQDRYVAVHRVPMLSLNEMLAQAGQAKVDFVSIDVEGMELEVLRGFDLSRHAPALMLIEDHLLSWKTHLHMRQSGYQLVKRTGLNNWYVPNGRGFRFSSAFERVRLWRKVWAGTPLRAAKHRLELWRKKTPQG
jgi:FkbM family methyltransferase